MKTMFKYNVMAAALLLSLNVACEDPYGPEPPGTGEGGVQDAAATLVTIDENGAYETFFKPQIGWTGDVMPFYDEASGTYHLFYLQDWRQSGPIHPVWQVETKDFATYANNAAAVTNGVAGEQDEAIGTGSVIKGNDGKYYCFYTGERSTNYVDGTPRQAVLRASSSDLKTWHKDRDFKMISASPDYNYKEFRDPCVIWDEDKQVYRMFVASDYKGYTSKAIAHYTSADLTNWTLQAKPLYENQETFTECPDVFKIGDYWYIVYSSIDDPRTVRYVYKSGSLDDDTPWSSPTALEGKMYYAAKTAPAQDGGRYLAGWCMTLEGTFDSSGWGGSMVVHKLSQKPGTAELQLTVPEAVSAKFSTPVALEAVDQYGEASQNGSNYTLREGSRVRFARLHSPAKISVNLHRNSDEFIAGFSFAAADEADTQNKIIMLMEPSASKFDLVYDQQGAANTQMNYLSLWALQDAREFDVEILIEKSVVVVYINDMLVMSNRIYQTDGNPWTIFCDKGEAVFSDLSIHTY